MSPKEKIISQATIAWASLFIALGCYGVLTGQYYIPSKSSGLIVGGDAYPLSILTLVLGASVAIPEALKLLGFKLEKYKKPLLAIQYSLAAAIIYIAFRKFF
ncbi:hypothetical protein [Atopomonas sediminilitoris]|uniref:hypothetical protein n=1 Tax=Atopomonas sediminilitoris TaxID=2919919 RepID=UPI001F4EB940|nr:hypothetical protein [Atopomonas sediminilitoris]MCJ8170917.1 hypothetical protein [Atopomonas sediminilitoris]